MNKAKIALAACVTLFGIMLAANAQIQIGWSYTPGQDIDELIVKDEAAISEMDARGIGVDELAIDLIQAKDENAFGNKTLALELLNKIAMRKEQAFYLLDFIRAIELKIEDYSIQGIDITPEKSKLEEAKKQIGKGRLDDAERILADTNAALDTKFSDAQSVRAMVRAGRIKLFVYIQKHWVGVVGVFIGLIAFISLVSLLTHEKRLKDKISMMKIEQDTIMQLMADTQKDYFQYQKIPQSVYDIKMNSYRHRLAQLKETLPVLEAKLKKKQAEKIISEAEERHKLSSTLR